MKKSFICHSVSRRQVWKEFSLVTKAPGSVFTGGKLRDMHRDVLTGVGVEEARGGNKTPRGEKLLQ